MDGRKMAVTPTVVEWVCHNTIPTEGITMEMIAVRSSAISAIGHDPETLRMRVRFRDSGTYDFCGVPEHVFLRFLQAPSKGRYYHRHIKGRYLCY